MRRPAPASSPDRPITWREGRPTESESGRGHARHQTVRDEVLSAATRLSWLSECFELNTYSADELSNWSDEREFLARLTPFAQATGSGSIHALWLHRDGVSLSEAPVAVLGDERGIHVVAKNLLALLQILSFDVEPMIDWDSVSFYKPDDHEPSDRANEYAKWLASELGLAPIADALVTGGQQEHKAAFDRWVKQFVSV